MFESLGDRLQNAINKIKGYGKITEDNIINCTVTPGQTYTAGNGIKIEDNVISCTVTPGQIYTAGNGIEIAEDNIDSNVPVADE